MRIPRRTALGWLGTLALGRFRPAAAQTAQPASVVAHASGDDIAREAERVNQGFVTERSALTLILTSAHGDRTERRLSLEIREDEAQGNQTRIDFEWPENVRGTILLTHARKVGDDEQWLYLPSAGRVRRVSAGQQAGSFMGSEFTYEDLTPTVAAKYTHTRMADDTADGRPCFALERRPRGDASGYSRERLWLDKERMVPIMVEFYDRKNELLKVATYRDYLTFGRYHRAALVRMENRQTRRISELKTQGRQLGIKLDALRFRSQALGR